VFKNFEILTVIIFVQFLTLQSGDERSRLVPVMDTILRLSPEETNKLSMVARGNLFLYDDSNFLNYNYVS
jgi:hypothetical protein